MKNKNNFYDQKFFKSKKLAKIFYSFAEMLAILFFALSTMFLVGSIAVLIYAALGSFAEIDATKHMNTSGVFVFGSLFLSAFCFLLCKVSRRIMQAIATSVLKDFDNWLKSNYSIFVNQDFKNSGIRYQDLLHFITTPYQGEVTFVDNKNVSHILAKTIEGVVLQKPSEKKGIIPIAIDNSNHFYNQIIETINVQNLLKSLSEDERKTLRYITRTTKILSQYKLTADQEHILMRNVEDLAQLNTTVGNLIKVEKIEDNLTRISEILNKIHDEVMQVEEIVTGKFIDTLYDKVNEIVNRNKPVEEYQQMLKIVTGFVPDDAIFTNSVSAGAITEKLAW